MRFIPTDLKDVWLIEPRVFTDSRGFFMETYSREAFEKQGISSVFVQDNHSKSVQMGTLRGLHFQKTPFEQAKLVRVIAGAIYDVVVDIRRESDTCGKWAGFTLSSENHTMLFIPKGCAHGFCTLQPDTHVVYKVDSPYSPDHDSGIRWNDPDLGIPWPSDTPILSEKDSELPFFSEYRSPE